MSLLFVALSCVPTSHPESMSLVELVLQSQRTEYTGGSPKEVMQMTVAPKGTVPPLGTQCLCSLCQPSVPAWPLLSSRGCLISFPPSSPSCYAMKRPRVTHSPILQLLDATALETQKSLTMVSKFSDNHIIGEQGGESK